MKLENYIKKIILEHLENEKEMKDILLKRIPFLNDFTDYSPQNEEYKNSLLYKKEGVTKDFQMVIDDNEIITFPACFTTVKVIYHPYKNLSIFSVDFSLTLVPPSDMTNTQEASEIIKITNDVSEKYTYYDDVYIPDGRTISKENLDRIINQMNGALFRIEDYTNKIGVNLF